MNGRKALDQYAQTLGIAAKPEKFRPPLTAEQKQIQRLEQVVAVLGECLGFAMKALRFYNDIHATKVLQIIGAKLRAAKVEVAE